MKRITIFALLIGTIAFYGFKSKDTIKIGDQWPQSETLMKNAVDGKEISFATEKQPYGLLVIFSCNTCPYVIKNEARIAAICKYAKEKSIGVVVVNSNEAKRSEDDSEAAMKKYATAQNYNWAYTIDTDSKMADAFGANRTPECFLFNEENKLVYHGAIDDSPADATKIKREHLKEAINETAEGKEVTIKESKSVGCTIKRKS